MRFMMLVKAGKDYEAGQPPDATLSERIGQLGEELVRRGVMVEMGGLLPSAQGARVRVTRGKLAVTDGPFAEAKELVGGYAIMRTRSKEEAVRLGTDFMQLHLDVLGPSYEGELEIRQLFDPADLAGQEGAADVR
jgi:hypothetical protein